MKQFLSPALFLVPFLLALTVLAGAQSPPRQSTAQPPSQVARPDSIQESGLYGYWNNMTGQGRAGGALLGKVAVEGEPLLWNPIVVSVLCNGATAYNTQTDAKGNFGIILAPTSTEPDAKRLMESKFEDCTVQANFTGFHSSSITITQHHLRDEPDLGTITLSRSGGRAAATAISTTIESAPVAAVKAYDKARTELIDQKPDKARRDLEKAVQAYPTFAAAWYQLGILQEVENSGDARGSFARAAAADPQFVLPYEQLAALDAQGQKWQDVLDNTNHALSLDPGGTIHTWYFNALANFQLGKTDAAEAAALKALTLDPAHTVPHVEQLVAVILAKKGDYAGALSHLRNCLTYLPSGESADMVKKQIALLESRSGGAK
jgi:tetratricopeptide (TPR) repeat protein